MNSWIHQTILGAPICELDIRRSWRARWCLPLTRGRYPPQPTWQLPPLALTLPWKIVGSNPTGSATNFERVPLSRSELLLVSLLESEVNEGLVFTVPMLEFGGTYDNSVAENRCEIRKGSNHSGFEPASCRDLMSLLLTPAPPGPHRDKISIQADGRINRACTQPV